AAARTFIYIENQYFTAEKVGDALAARLAESDGPEIIVVLRQLSHGWLEELTMQTLRRRLIEKLRAADRHDRFRVFYPYIGGLKEGTCIDVHAKLMIVDDELVRIGSANLANRSMGLDTECDLTIAAEGRADIAQAIEALRCELLGEHLGCEPERVRDDVREKGSLRAAIDALRNDERTLEPLRDLAQASDAAMSVASVADPEKPVALSNLATQAGAVMPARRGAAVPPRPPGPAGGKIATTVLAIAALAASGKATPPAELLEANRQTQWAPDFRSKWWAPLVSVLACKPAVVTMFPRQLPTL